MHIIHVVFTNDEVNVNRFAEKIGADYCEVMRKFDVEKLNQDFQWFVERYTEADPHELVKEVKKKGKRFIYFLDCHV